MTHIQTRDATQFCQPPEQLQLDDDEQAIVKRYKLDEATLIEVEQPGLIRNSFIVGLIATVIALPFGGSVTASLIGAAIPIFAGVLVGSIYYHQKRETIYVRDLMHGRHFSCPSVVELARKEAWLTYVVGFLRQVMESAKHWDGTERHTVEPLPKDEARQVIIRGL